MADFFFFADYDLMNLQGSADAFSNLNMFSRHVLNTNHNSTTFVEEDHPQTSLFFGGNATGLFHRISGAYAVSDGRVFVVPEHTSINTGLSYTTSAAYWQQTVTIILQPSAQPRSGIPPIKYFIYTGILLSSLVDSVDKIAHDGRLATIINSNYNDLTRKILDALKTTSGSESFNNTLDKDYSLNKSVEYVKKLDEIFFRDNATYQLFEVQGGDCIGYFNHRPSPDEQKIGFGIIFDAVGYHPTINQLTGPSESLLDYSVKYNYGNFDFATSNPSALNDERFLGRENIKLNFLDPCAFYGSFASNVEDRIFARKFTDPFEVIQRTGATDNLPLRGRPIFTKQMFGTSAMDVNTNLYKNVISKFYNKNVVYVDIRNPENKALNFNGDYDIHAKLRIAQPPTSGAKAIYSNLSNIKSSDPNNNKTCISLDPSFFANSITLEYNDFDIALPDGKITNFTIGSEIYTDIINETPSVYVDQIYLQSGFPDSLLGSTNFVPAFVRNANSGYSSTIKLRVKNYDSDLQKPISTYIRINYLKESNNLILPKQSSCCNQSLPFPNPILEPLPSQVKTLRSYEYLDNFFTPFDMIIPHLNPGVLPNGIASNIYYDPKYLDNTKIGGVRMMAYPGIAQDKNGRVTLFAVPADTRAPNKEQIESGVNISGVIDNSLTNDGFIQHLSKKFKSLSSRFSKVVLEKTDIGEGDDRVVEFIRIDRGTGLNAFKNITAGTLAWITIERDDFTRLSQINTSRGNAEFIDTLSGVEFKADFVDPTKTYLGIKIKSTGSAKDKNNSNTLVDYIKYELILRNLTYNPITHKTEYKSIPTGIYSYSLRIDGPPITSKMFYPSVNENDKPYSIIPNPDGGSRIKSTVYLIKDANITDDELWEYMQYVQCNIRQVWTNRSDINSSTGQTYNCGKYNIGLLYNQIGLPDFEKIDAELVDVKIGTASQVLKLNAGECAFRVCKKSGSVIRTRSFAKITRNVGILFYNPISPHGSSDRTRFDELGDNVPAHEFGHLMGLKDRYTSTGVVNINNSKIVGEFEGNKPMFMNNFQNSPAFDSEYISEYNWAYNLYSTGKIVYGLSRNPLGEEPHNVLLKKLSNELDFRLFCDEIPSINKDKLPRNPTLETPERYGIICTFITKQQWSIVKNKEIEEEKAKSDSNPNVHRLFDNSEYVFLKSYNSENPPTTTVGVSFIGLSFDSLDADRAVSDLKYEDQSSRLVDGYMNTRLSTNTVDNSIAGYFSPYVSIVDGEKLDREDVEDNQQLLDSIVNPGLSTFLEISNDFTLTNKKSAIKSAFPNYNGISPEVDLTEFDPYKFVGDGNLVGRNVWNYGVQRKITVGSLTLKYTEHEFRKKIIERIQGVS